MEPDIILESLKITNLAVSFLLELCALAALAYWGVRTGQGLILKIGLGVGAPLLAAVMWGVFVSPKAPVSVHKHVRLVLQLVFFGLAAAALSATGRPTLAWVFVAAVAINGSLLHLWRR